jgi:hypothetical protein
MAAALYVIVPLHPDATDIILSAGVGLVAIIIIRTTSIRFVRFRFLISRTLMRTYSAFEPPWQNDVRSPVITLDHSLR